MSRPAVYLLLLPVLLVAVMVPSTPASTARGVVGRGDLTFYFDAASFLGDGGKLIEEVAIRIPNNELRFVKRGAGYRSHVRLTVKITDAGGATVVADRKERTFDEPGADRAESSRYFQTVVKRYVLDPGVYTISYAVEDLQAPRTSLFDRMKHRYKTSTVRELRTVLRAVPEDVPSFSDARFLWAVDRSVDPPVYHPNPARLYGLYRDTLAVYIELYLPDGIAGATTFDMRSEIVDDTLAVVSSNRMTLSNPGTRWGSGDVRAYPVEIRHDLNRLPAGIYYVYVAVSINGSMRQRVRCGSFSVAWDLRTWEVPRREFLAEARFLLPKEDYDNFAALETGAQEARIRELWKKEDPDPETEDNEAYLEFVSRLDFVRGHYDDAEGDGFSPRAEVYLRFGPPDEIVQDVIPLNRNTTEEAIDVVEDKFHTMNFSSHSLKVSSRGTTRSLIVDPRQLGGTRRGDNVAYPFELWVYSHRGSPVLDRDRASEIDIGMRYLFVDRRGYGNYRLESSSSITNK